MSLLRQGLFRRFIPRYQTRFLSEDLEKSLREYYGNEYNSIPPITPIVVSETKIESPTADGVIAYLQAETGSMPTVFRMPAASTSGFSACRVIVEHEARTRRIALAELLLKQLRTWKLKVRCEGRATEDADWVVVEAGEDLAVHLVSRQSREAYELDSKFADDVEKANNVEVTPTVAYQFDN